MLVSYRGGMDDLTPTATALTVARAMLGSVDHAARKRLDAEARLALVAEVVALGRQVEALRAVLVAEADRAKAGETARGASIKSLLAVSATVTAGEAAGWVYAGQELLARPRVQEAALTGEVSVAQARAIEHVLGELPATLSAGQREHAETLLLEQAGRSDAKDLARQGRAVLQAVAPEVDAIEDELTRLDTERKQAWATRELSFTPDGRGRIIIRGQLPLLEGERFKTLVETHTTTNRQALEQADTGHDVAGQRTFGQRTADGLIALMRSVGSRGDARAARPALVVTMSLDTLQAGLEQAGHLADGTPLTAGELRLVACDASVIPLVLGTASEPLDVGREQRLVTLPIRRALETRDGGCAFPGCRVPTHACEAHHVIPWWAGGTTAIENLVLLCPHHHGTIEPLRFFTAGSPPNRWSVHINTDGHPEFSPPGPRTNGLAQAPPRSPTLA